jgi:hypothetical protein
MHELLRHASKLHVGIGFLAEKLPLRTAAKITIRFASRTRKNYLSKPVFAILGTHLNSRSFHNPLSASEDRDCRDSESFVHLSLLNSDLAYVDEIAQDMLVISGEKLAFESDEVSGKPC